MTKQNYVKEFTQTFTEIVKVERMIKDQWELCKKLFFEYVTESVTARATKILKARSREITTLHEYTDEHIELTRELRGLKQSFIS